jgi:cell division protein FtsB
MSEIDDLKHRISAALERIKLGVEALPEPGADAPVADTEELDQLRAELGRMSAENAVLTAELESLQLAKGESEARAEIARVEAQSSYQHQIATVTRLDSELQSLRAANQQLRANNQALRKANTAGVGEPHLINKGLIAELDGLRADRAAEEAEAGAILGELKKVLDLQAGASVDAETSEAM